METFGAYLKAHREKKGIRLEEIASITKINLYNLELLEAGNFSKLPPEPFIRGFIIAYSKYIGLDPNEAVGRYVDEAHPHSKELSREEPKETAMSLGNSATRANDFEKSLTVDGRGSITNTGKEQTNIAATSSYRGMKYAASFATLAVIIASAFYFLPEGMFEDKVSIDLAPNRKLPEQSNQSDLASAKHNAKTIAQAPHAAAPMEPSPTTNPAKEEFVAIPSEKAAVQAENNTVENVRALASANPKLVEERIGKAAPVEQPAKADDTASVAKKSEHEVSIEASERTWVKVVLDDKAPVEFFLPQGEKASYQADEKVKIVLGNSTGSTVTHNGEIASGNKVQGTIRSYVFPTGSRFPQDVIKRPKLQPQALPEETSSESDTHEPPPEEPAPKN